MNPNNDLQRQAFLNAIQEDPRDELNRKAYADWLEENDEPEEADFFRSFSTEQYDESKKWIEDFVSDINSEDHVYDRSANVTYEEVMATASACLDDVDRDRYEYICLPFDTPDELYGGSSKIQEFWKHFQVVTARRILDKEYSEGFFRCAC